MGTLGEPPGIAPRTKYDIQEGNEQSASGAEYGQAVTAQGGTKRGTADGCDKRHAIGQICRAPHAARCDGYGYPVTNSGADRIFHAIAFLSAAEHLGQLLAATAALFVTTSTTALVDDDMGLFSIQRLDACKNGRLFCIHGYQRLSEAVSSKGRSFSATASRARKIRERTVPIGQSMIPAISS